MKEGESEKDASDESDYENDEEFLNDFFKETD